MLLAAVLPLLRSLASLALLKFVLHSSYILLYVFKFSNKCVYEHAMIKINTRPINSLPNPLLRAFKHLRYLYSLSVSNPYQNIARRSQIHLFHYPLPITTFRQQTISISYYYYYDGNNNCNISTCNISKIISHYREQCTAAECIKYHYDVHLRTVYTSSIARVISYYCGAGSIKTCWEENRRTEL